MRLLLVEDDASLCEAVRVYMEKEGYSIDICQNGSDVFYYTKKHVHDVIILDRMLPEKDGLTIVKELREKRVATPVIMVTALDGLHDRIDGLDQGADDYLPKPFALEELDARIRALIRRNKKLEGQMSLLYGDIAFDATCSLLKKGEKELTLSKRESALIEYFLLNTDQVLSREQILTRVWGPDSFVEEGNLDNYIYFLRRRLKTMESIVKIKTIHGVGYSMGKE